MVDPSILEQLSPSLCEAVTGQKASRKCLHDLENNNLFLAPLDEERTWYRYHAFTKGKIVVRHPELRGLPDLRGITDYRNEWNLRLYDEVPMDLNVDMGAGTSDLQLAGLSLTRLEVSLGTGSGLGPRSRSGMAPWEGMNMPQSISLKLSPPLMPFPETPGFKVTSL